MARPKSPLDCDPALPTPPVSDKTQRHLGGLCIYYATYSHNFLRNGEETSECACVRRNLISGVLWNGMGFEKTYKVLGCVFGREGCCRIRKVGSGLPDYLVTNTLSEHEWFCVDSKGKLLSDLESQEAGVVFV